MSLDEIRCNEEGDGFGSAEPYLWTVFFKIDGDSVIVGDDTFLQGECTIMASDGSHGNLGDRDVDAGDTLVVPRSIGEFRTTLRPIPRSEKLQEDHPTEDARGGTLGVVFALLEEDQVTDGVARAAGDPSAYFNSAENVVVYRAPGNHVHDVYWSTGEAGHEDLSGVARPPAVGVPVAYYIPSADLQQVTYRIGGGHLYEMYWRGGDPPTGWYLMERSGAPEAVSDPVVFYSAATNTKHAIYGGFDNQFHEIFWTARPGASPGQQSNWRWCNKCQGLFYGGNVASSRCPTGGAHTTPNQSGSADYILPESGPIL